jgi:uncharacterized peroxidase-related enzyme
MPRLQAIDPAQAEGKAKALLDGVQKTLGMTPNLMRTLANSPAALEAYLGFLRALGGTGFDAKAREAIALAVAGENGCDYCASAHGALGARLGVTPEELARNLAARSAEPKLDAALRFAKTMVAKRGWVSDQDLRGVREAGHDDGAITDIVAIVAANVFSNYFNHVAQTEVDFPAVETRGRVAA